MNGVHCQVSPTSTMSRADHASVAHDQSPTPRPEEGRERSLLHVGEHAEGVGDADRRDHQRHEEEHAEEVASADSLGAEQGDARGRAGTAR